MNQSERRRFLIQALLRERPAYRGTEIPAGTEEQRQLLQGKKLQQLPLFHKNNFYSSSRNVSGVFFSSFLNTLQK